MPYRRPAVIELILCQYYVDRNGGQFFKRNHVGGDLQRNGFRLQLCRAVRTKRHSKHFVKCRGIVNFFSDILIHRVGT